MIRKLMVTMALILTGMMIVYLLQRPPQEIHAVQAEAKNMENNIMVQGTADATSKSRIGAELGCTVQQTYVSVGEFVQAGDPLLSLVPQKTDAAAWVQSVLSGSNVSIAGTVQHGAVLYANMEGNVLHLAEVGDILFPMQTAAEIADLHRIQVHADIPEIYAGKIAVGQTCRISPITDSEQKIFGTVTSVSGEIQEKTSLIGQSSGKNLRCLITTDSSSCLMPGMTTEISICVDRRENTVSVPCSAVRQEEKQEYVYVVQDQCVSRRIVQTGYQLADQIEVQSGLQVGEWVAVDGNLQPGESYRVIYDDAA